MIIIKKSLPPTIVKDLSVAISHRGPSKNGGQWQVASKVSGDRTQVPLFKHSLDQKQSPIGMHSAPISFRPIGHLPNKKAK